MNRPGCSAIVAFLLLVILFPQSAASYKLWGTAEDLWGNKIDLSRLQQGVVLIHPISTSH